MRKLFLVSIIATVAVSCNQSADNSAANIALVQQYLEAVDNNDYQAMETLLADDYLGLGPSMDDSTNKEAAIASWKWNSENLYEEVEYDRTQTFSSTITDGPHAGEWAYNWAEVTIRYKDGVGPVRLMMNAVYKIENGKIARTRTFYNEAEVWEQLGFRIFPPLEVPESEETE
jgi:ketosteroid isomerase-like protein